MPERYHAQDAQIRQHILEDDGIYPNNQLLPLLAYKGAVPLDGSDPASIFEELFEAHHWGSSWRNGVFSYHHYHSSAHEVLGVYGGTAHVQLGGEQGPVFSIEAGDVLIIPAGVAHKNLGDSHGFRVVGAYPQGQRPDICYGRDGERPRADRTISGLALPQADPVYGADGPLIELWIL